MLIERFVINDISTNTYVVGADGGEAIIIDPSSTDLTEVLNFVKDKCLQIKAIINTHCHFDHVLGNEFLRTALDVPLFAHVLDEPILMNAPNTARRVLGEEISVQKADRYLREGEEVPVGSLRFSVLETPGHTPGGICLYEAHERIVFTGDTLFAGTVGRTDLAGGNKEQLLRSLREKLWVLPDDTIVYPGHGDDSTISDERMHNPWFHDIIGR